MNPTNYFDNERYDNKRELNLTNQLLQKTGKVFPEVIIEDRWPYDISEGELIRIPTIKNKDKPDELSYSHSTNAMILFSLIAASGEIPSNSPLIPDICLNEKFDFVKDKDQYESVWNELKRQIIKEHEVDDSDKIVYSSTFGINDPLTLCWLIEIVRSNVFEEDDSFKTLLSKTIKTTQKKL